MLIQVIEEDIAKGGTSNTDCPLAIAIKSDLAADEVSVGLSTATVRRGGYTDIYILSIEARQFDRDFVLGLPVKAGEFTLTYSGTLKKV